MNRRFNPHDDHVSYMLVIFSSPLGKWDGLREGEGTYLRSVVTKSLRGRAELQIQAVCLRSLHESPLLALIALG